MRRLLALVLFLSASLVGAQTDERRVRTVQTDDVSAQDEPAERRTDPAEHPDERMILARQLVALATDGADDADSGAACSASPDIVAAYLASPADFHGISPQSAYWPAVERAWHAYHGDDCDAAPAAILARSYAEQLTTAELREVIAFQDSPSGRIFIAATRRARTVLENELAARTYRDPSIAADTFRQAMLGLKATYARDPK